MKSDLQSSQGLVEMKWEPKEECHSPTEFDKRAYFKSGWFMKKYLMLCQISRSKSTLVQFKKSDSQSSQGMSKWI